RRATLSRAAYNRDENDTDEDLGHAECVSSRFSRADELLAHPCGEHRSQYQTAHGARHAPLFFVMLRAFCFDTREGCRVRLQREKYVKCVRDEQQTSDANVQKFLFANYTLWRKDATERAWHRHANRGEEHHRAVSAGGGWVEFLIVEAKAAGKKCYAQRQQQ